MSVLPHQELQSSTTGEKFSLSAMLSDSFGFKDLRVHHEIIPPGRRASSSHAHSKNEEMIYILEGEPTVISGNEEIKLQAGDAFAFRIMVPSHLENRSATSVKVLVISSNHPGDQVTYRFDTTIRTQI